MPAEFVQQIAAWIFLKSLLMFLLKSPSKVESGIGKFWLKVYLKGWLESLCGALLWVYAFFFFVCFRQNQVVLLETLEQEISKFKECNSIVDINALVSTSNAF